MVVLAEADATDAEIAQALISTVKNPENAVAYRDGQTEVRRVWARASIPYEGLIAGGSVQVMVQWKLPPKGIPVLKGRGLKMCVFNTDVANAFSNGPSFKSISIMMGDWF